MMPGWRGEQYDPPSAEDLEEQHPRLFAQMQRHNEIWERAWRYYNLDLEDVKESAAAREEQKAASEAAREYALANATESPDELVEAIDDYDEYGEEEEEKPKKKKGKKGKKGGKTGPASLTLSLRNAGAAVERAFEGMGKFALRRPEIQRFAERRAQQKRAQQQQGEEQQRAGPAMPFASLSLSMPFGPFSR